MVYGKSEKNAVQLYPSSRVPHVMCRPYIENAKGLFI